MKRHIKQFLNNMIRRVSERRLYFAVLVSLTALLIVSATMLVILHTQAMNEQTSLQELSKRAGASAPPMPAAMETPEDAPWATPIPAQTPQEPVMLERYRALYEQNPDMVGWIRIDGTKIDYPVMYTPDDGEFYLDHGFDKEKSKSGVPFIDKRCTVYPFGTNTILYGHHMKNGTMFAGLDSYRDEGYYREHPVIRFDTLYEQREYEIIAVFESQIYRKRDTVFKHYNFLNAQDAAAFDDYIANIKALSLYDTGVTAVYGDELVTLSTCAYHTENGQFVVVAKGMLRALPYGPTVRNGRICPYGPILPCSLGLRFTSSATGGATARRPSARSRLPARASASAPKLPLRAVTALRTPTQKTS